MADFDTRVAAIDERLVFGEVASGLCLAGASRIGWTCPACGTVHALKERADHKGARCTYPGCKAGFGMLALVMRVRGSSAWASLGWLDRLLDERDLKGARRAGLFDFDDPAKNRTKDKADG